MWVWIIVSFVLLCIALLEGAVIRNLLLQNEQLTEFAERALSNAVATYLRMKRLDASGAFASDDDVGFTFKELHTAVLDYATFLGVNEEILTDENLEEELLEEESAEENEK